MTYEGEYENDLRSGKGIITCPTFTYEGEFKNDKFNGKGKIKIVGGGEYEGEWKDGKRNGIGTQRF